MLSPDQRAELLRVYLATGSYAEAGRAVGITRQSARDSLRQTDDGLQRLTLIARASDAVVAEAMDASRAAVRSNRKLLANPKTATDAAFAINDSLRAATQTRVAIAKLTGEHAPDKHALDMSARVVLLPDLEDDGSGPGPGANPGPEGALASEPGAPDQVSR